MSKMLSSFTSYEQCSPTLLSAPMSFTDSMNSFLDSTSAVTMETCDTSVDVTEYFDNYDEDNCNLLSCSALITSTTSDHETLSRTSSSESSGLPTALKYTSPGSFVSTSSVDSTDKDTILASVRDVDCEDFPYEDVLSLENALGEAVGDSIEEVARHEHLQSSNVNKKDGKELNVSFSKPPHQHVLPSESKSGYFSSAASSTLQTASPIPPISNIFPKVTHRVVISPKTTLVLSDDVLRKKHRQISVSRSTSLKNEENSEGGGNSSTRFPTSLSRKLSGSSAKIRTDNRSKSLCSPVPEVHPAFSRRNIGSTSSITYIPACGGTSVTSDHFTLSTSSKAVSAQRKTLIQVDEYSTADERQPSPILLGHLRAKKHTSRPIQILQEPTLPCSKSSTSTQTKPKVTSSSPATTWVDPTDPDAGKKISLPFQKQPLPPEGYKITRYPLEQTSKDVAVDEDKFDDKNPGLVEALRQQLREARMDIGQYLKEVENWKTTAQHTFEAARKIRAQMELERSRADRAESRISQLTTHFRSKLLERANSFTKSGNNRKSSSSSSSTCFSPIDAEDLGTSSKKRTLSDPPNILSRKRRRTGSELDGATRDLATWLMSTQYSSTVKSGRSSTSKTPRTVSESIFSSSKLKEDLVYSPQVNSGVRLALRAKVCSARGDSLNTACELLKQTKLLTADLPTVPQSVSDSRSLGSTEDHVTSGSRWNNVESMLSATSGSRLSSSDSNLSSSVYSSLSESLEK